jgi:hypothetical protein
MVVVSAILSFEEGHLDIPHFPHLWYTGVLPSPSYKTAMYYRFKKSYPLRKSQSSGLPDSPGQLQSLSGSDLVKLWCAQKWDGVICSN